MFYKVRTFFQDYLTILAGALFFMGITSCANADMKVQDVKDFHVLSQQMEDKKMPLLLAFTAEYCHYCRQLEGDFLQPMLKSGDYDNRTLIRSVVIDTYDSVVDFNEQKIDMDDFVSRYNIAVTPTVIFLDHEGREIAERLVGINTPEMFGGYLDTSIDDAEEQVKKQ